jgi:serine/threonine protein kinase
MKVALGVAKALAYLHCAEINVIVRDVKNSNILLDRVSESSVHRTSPI